MSHLSVLQVPQSSDCIACFRIHTWSQFLKGVLLPGFYFAGEGTSQSLKESPEATWSLTSAILSTEHSLLPSVFSSEITVVNSRQQGHRCKLPHLLPLLSKIVVINNHVITSDTIFRGRLDFKYIIKFNKIFHVWNKFCIYQTKDIISGNLYCCIVLHFPRKCKLHVLT